MGGHVTGTRKSEMLKIVTGNTKEGKPVVSPMHEWYFSALEESAQVLKQSEREKEKKYIECAVVVVQCEREKEQEKAQPHLFILAVC